MLKMQADVQKKLEKFFSGYRQIKYKKGELLLRADDPPPGIFLLKGGVVRQYAISPKGDDLTLNIYRPVSFFPVAFFINGSRNNYYFEAMTPVFVFRSPGEEFLKFIKKEPDIMFDLLKRIYTGLEGFFSRMENLMSGEVKNRLVLELLIYARRFGTKTDAGTAIGLKLTQKDLAAQIGVARETVGRIMKDLKNKKLISRQDKKMVISDITRLEEQLF